MIYLFSHKRFGDFAKLNHFDGTYELFDRETNKFPDNISQSGNFDIIDDHFIAFYPFENKFYLRIDEYCTQVTENTEFDLSGSTSKRTLSIKHDGQEIICVTYDVDDSVLSPNDLTAFAELEDFDFGLFLNRIVKGKGRQRVMLGLD